MLLRAEVPREPARRERPVERGEADRREAKGTADIEEDPGNEIAGEESVSREGESRKNGKNANPDENGVEGFGLHSVGLRDLCRLEGWLNMASLDCLENAVASTRYDEVHNEACDHKDERNDEPHDRRECGILRGRRKEGESPKQCGWREQDEHERDEV